MLAAVIACLPLLLVCFVLESPFLVVQSFFLPYFENRLLPLVQNEPPLGKRELVGIDDVESDENDDDVGT